MMQNSVRNLLFAFSFLLMAALFPMSAVSQDVSQGLFTGAKALYTAAQSKPEEERLRDYLSVQKLLDLIVADHPSTDLAVQILLQENIDGLDIAALNKALLEEEHAPVLVEVGGFLGTWEDGGPYCAEISAGYTENETTLLLWYCEAGRENSANLNLTATADGLVGTNHPIEVTQINGDEININLFEPVLDRFQNQIGPSGEGFVTRFTRAAGQAPALPNFLDENDTADASEIAAGTQESERALELEKLAYRDIQARLLVLGFDPNGIDGVPGRGTRSALSSWQTVQGIAPTGYVNAQQIDHLKQMSETALAAWRLIPENEELYTPPPPMEIGPGNVSGRWRYTSTCGRNSKIGTVKITGAFVVAHTGGNRYAGRITNSQGLRGTFSGRLNGRRFDSEANWGLFIGRTQVSGRVADYKLTMSGRDSLGCSFYAYKSN